MCHPEQAFFACEGSFNYHQILHRQKTPVQDDIYYLAITSFNANPDWIFSYSQINTNYVYNELLVEHFLIYREKHNGSKEKRRQKEEVNSKAREGACIFPGLFPAHITTFSFF